ncbi:MAG TPA: hypothetical protein VJR89_17470 [Polyangiales bacterium]|nr:hypothetical protein [Polyangiales bacterium]
MWKNPEMLQTAISPSLARLTIDNQGKATVMWRHRLERGDTIMTVSAQRYQPGQGWSPATHLSRDVADGNSNVMPCALRADDAGNVTALMMTLPTEFVGANVEELLSQLTGPLYVKRRSVTGSWGASEKLGMSRYLSREGWQAARTISADDREVDYPAVALSHAGSGVALWRDTTELQAFSLWAVAYE